MVESIINLTAFFACLSLKRGKASNLSSVICNLTKLLTFLALVSCTRCQWTARTLTQATFTGTLFPDRQTVTTENFSTLRTNRLVSYDMLQWPHVACWQHPSSLQFWGLARQSRCHRYPRAPTPRLEFKLAPLSASGWETESRKTALPCLHIAHRPITLISSGVNEEQAVRNNKQFIIFFSVQISFTFHTDCT